jgi:hypothetical protein
LKEHREFHEFRNFSKLILTSSFCISRQKNQNELINLNCLVSAENLKRSILTSLKCNLIKTETILKKKQSDFATASMCL